MMQTCNFLKVFLLIFEEPQLTSYRGLIDILKILCKREYVYLYVSRVFYDVMGVDLLCSVLFCRKQQQNQSGSCSTYQCLQKLHLGKDKLASIT